MELPSSGEKKKKKILLLSSTPSALKPILNMKAHSHEIYVVGRIEQLMGLPLSQYDVRIVFNFRYILPARLVDNYTFWNIHYSLLPRYRGPNPVRTVLLVGEKYTGLTVHKVTADIDAGPIVYQERLGIPPLLNYKELFKHITGILIARWESIIDLISSDNTVLKEQGEGATYTNLYCCNKRLIVEDIRSYTAQELYNRVRAFNPDPGVWLSVYLDGRPRYLVLRRVAPVLDIKIKPGSILYDKTRGRVVLGSAYGGVELLEGGLIGKKVLQKEQWFSLKGRLQLARG